MKFRGHVSVRPMNFACAGGHTNTYKTYPGSNCQCCIFPHRLSDGRRTCGCLETSWNWELCKLCECVCWISDMSFTEEHSHSRAWESNNKFAPELQNK